ncbi:MAG: coiled coil domain-containing protein [Nitrospirota bacterium]
MGMQNTYRKAYQDKLEAQIKEWAAKIEVLKSKAEQAEASAKIEYHKQIEAISTKYEAAHTKLRELKEAGEDAWESLKTGAEKAWADLKEAVEHATAKLK